MNKELLISAIHSGNEDLINKLIAPPKIHAAMANVMKDIKHVGKNQSGKGLNYAFRGIDDMYNAVHAAMAVHGVTQTFEVLERTETEKVAKSGSKAACVLVRVKYTYHAEDGSSVSTIVDGEASDYGDKATSKALSMADKYNLIQTFKVPTSDIADGDKEAFELSKPEIPRIGEEEINWVKQAIADSNTSETSFNGWLKKNRCNSIENISTAFYPEVKRMLENALSKAGA